VDPSTDLAAALSLPFMQRALVGCVLVGLICALLGVFVVLQHLAFIGQGVAQGALPGLAIGFWLQLNLYMSALVSAVGLALAIAYLRERGRVATDTAIAIAYSVAAAAGVALIAVVRFGPVDLNSFLFGNVLAITSADLVVLGISVIGVAAVLYGYYRDLAYSAFDPDGAAAAGVPVRGLGYIFMVLIAVVAVVSLQTVGLILVTALLVMPAAAARQWANRLPHLLMLSTVFGMLGSLLGLLGSFYLRLPSGATIVLTVALMFGVSLAIRSLLDQLDRSRSSARVVVSDVPADPRASPGAAR
jgi:ABC-type Mn2+/Zn2+ transport system permease subunit